MQKALLVTVPRLYAVTDTGSLGLSSPERAKSAWTLTRKEMVLGLERWRELL